MTWHDLVLLVWQAGSGHDINDISDGINPGTNILLYADDTKMWREINYSSDHTMLQKDINYLIDWALRNSMKFHPSKCKVLSVSHSRTSLLHYLPFTTYHYRMRNNFLDYVNNETDLGIIMTKTLNFTTHSDKFLVK